MSRRKYLEEGWKSFEEKVMGPLPGAQQRHDMRGAFFAGAYIAFTTLSSQVSDGDDITAEDMSLMESIDRELTEFQAEVSAEAAASRAARKRSEL